MPGPHLRNQLLQRVYVSAVVARFVDGRFGDEGAMAKARIIEQAPEWLDTDGAFADVLMTVELRSSRGEIRSSSNAMRASTAGSLSPSMVERRMVSATD